ncbi:hypothetical protein D3C71_2118230 [compost metagenome]
MLLARLGFETVGVDSVDITDGLRITLNDGSIIHLRPSGNAPELRCYVESDNSNVAHGMVYSCLSSLVNYE